MREPGACDQMSGLKSPTLPTSHIEVGMLALPNVSEEKYESIKCCLGQHTSHGGVNFNKIKKKVCQLQVGNFEFTSV